MQNTPLILLGLTILACFVIRRQDNLKPTRFQHLNGGQKLLGIIAVILTLLILLNPEFLALGLLGDAAFFDVLVLAVSLQMHTYATRVCRWFVNVLPKIARRIGIPSPGLSYLLTVSTLAIGSLVSMMQKAYKR